MLQHSRWFITRSSVNRIIATFKKNDSTPNNNIVKSPVKRQLKIGEKLTEEYINEEVKGEKIEEVIEEIDELVKYKFYKNPVPTLILLCIQYYLHVS